MTRAAMRLAATAPEWDPAANKSKQEVFTRLHLKGRKL
jgi:hypothetical protein